jgi:hypothetical protein
MPTETAKFISNTNPVFFRELANKHTNKYAGTIKWVQTRKQTEQSQEDN